MQTYTSIHNHTAAGSNTRLLDSINKVEELIQYAYDIGLDAIGISDHESVKALPAAQAYMRKMREKFPESRWQDFKVIYGNEIYLTRNGLNGKTYDSKKDKFFHLVLAAKNPRGHEQIRELSTRAYSHSFMRMMLRVPTWYKDFEEIIGSEPGNVIVSTACLGSQLDQMILHASQYKTKFPEAFEEEMEKAKNFALWLQGVVGQGNFFLELQPSHNEEQVYVNNELIKLSCELNIPAIISTDSHYLRAEDRPIHKAYLNSKEGDREVDDFYATTYVMTAEEIHSYMDQYIGAEVVDNCLANTRLIYDMVENWELKNPFKLPYLPSQEDIDFAKAPYYPFPKDVKLNWDIWNQFINSKENSDKVFIKRIIDRSNKENLWSEDRIERLETELQTVWDSSVKQNMTWSKYFLQVADYIEVAWNEGDSLVAPGRGSGVGFYINYLCDIIQVDPMREKAPMLYWRFLNPERASILDLDSDVQSNRRNKIIEALQNKYGAERVIRVSTERTEASKASILTAARGLGIELETAQYIASLIESDRGIQRSLRQTYYGDEEKGFAPNSTFKTEMDKYPELWETAQRIEGLPCGEGIHAGGVIIVDEPITKGNSLIKLNSGEWATAFDLHESENVGGQVKIDLLATKGMTIIRTCLDLLVKAGYIEQKATLRETYEDAIGVYKLKRDNSEMWAKLARQEIINTFQFDTPQGIQACTLCKPTSIEELSALNATMRLMSDGSEQPLEKFKRFKEHPQDWDEEMKSYGLTNDERKLFHSYLDYEYGIAASQEDLMRMIQDPQIGGWSLGRSDQLRKSVAKKDKKLFEELTKSYFQEVEEKNLSKNLCNYFWNVCVQGQVGYAFNLSHTLSYSIIALQEMNLACNYPIIFWNTANLIVESSGAEIDDDDDEKENENNCVKEVEQEVETEDDDEEEDEEEAEVKRAKKTVNYGKVASAIGKFQSRGVSIFPPDINKSSYTFTPVVETNSITYGLRGITRVSESVIQDIIRNRPYTSFENFLEKNKTNKLQTLNLIKSGAFDSLEGDREELMQRYINMIADKKQRLTLQNMQGLINYEIIPEDMAFYAKLFLFNKFLKKNKNGVYYGLNDSALNFISNNFDFDATKDGDKILQKTWDAIYKKAMDPMRDYIKKNSTSMLRQLNDALFDEQWEKYALGNISKWEMDSISFYYHEHELANARMQLTNFFDLPEEPIVDYTFPTKNGQEVKVFKLSLIAGTVIDKNKLKNTVTLLTPDGVVTVKIYKNQYSQFDKQLSERGEDGRKRILERSWFSRGNLLLIQGVRRGSDFIPKKRRDSLYPVITKINKINDDGALELQFERMEVEE